MSAPAAPTTGLDAAAAAAELHAARLARRTLPTLTGRHPGLTLDEAYAVQAEGIGLRLADGERVVGGKLGFTSAAMRAAMGVDAPNHGWLTDAMLLPTPGGDGAVAVPADVLVHPKVEPEVAFRLGADLGPGATTDDVLAATEAVLPCLELVDSRWDGFRFGPLDNVADDSSAGLVALGEPRPVGDLDLRLLGVVLSVDGAAVHTAAGAACHGHPAAAVAWMAENATTGPRVGGAPLRAGDLVLSGGLTTPVDLVPGTTVTAELDRLGSVTVHLPATDRRSS